MAMTVMATASAKKLDKKTRTRPRKPNLKGAEGRFVEEGNWALVM
jgi:hypothetical protein